ncbi:hypothetical protein HII31_04443 [Pseudocercospora fuligena]|uniref:WSC domain-containing protein n=1 Tax=Pseudocercospora fuligena TaxID=685502 RepID=A0A8H6RKP9_9PEZI|nr:hypothetical protein HII31_04443 [Pseudocercospora fuligena]
MKFLSTALALCGLAAETSAAFIPPFPFFRAISLTLPGATYRKRSEQEISLQSAESSALEKRADLFSACGTLNLASKYQNYPINGYGYACAQFAFGGYQGSSAYIGLTTTYSTAKTAYDCCVTAMQQANSTLFFFTSNPTAFTFGGGPAQNCQVVSNSQCPIPRTEAITMAVSYNASAPRGTSYGNYAGNGNCGPGVRLAINNAVLGQCVGSSAGVGVNNGPGGGSSAGSAGSAAAACSYSGPNVPDQGGTNPVGSGSSAGSGSSSG